MLAQATSKAAVAATDRFIGFAFASADLLVETDLDGVIAFATGAFRSRLGSNPAWYVGRPIGCLFVPADTQALEMALAGVRLRGRIAPLVLRLADAGASPIAVAAMLMPGCAADNQYPAREARLCFSIGPVPRAADPFHAQKFQDRAAFICLAEDAIRTGQSGGLGLLQVSPARGSSPADRAALRDSIRHAIEQAAPGAATGELGDGRFGVLSQSEVDIRQVVSRLEAQLSSSGIKTESPIAASDMQLDATGLPPTQAVRALRYALGRFAEGQATAGSAIGGTAGLAGIIATAETRARNLRGTIADRKFRLLFQPVVGLTTRKVHHYEALIRPIPVPGEPAQSIQDFVTFAEMVGLSEELDWAVLQTALDALRGSPMASVAVNMSGLSMQSSSYRHRMLTQLGEVRDLIGSKGINRLLIELTETAEIDDLEGAAVAMAELRQAGVKVCLDDFGAGASAFRYLRAFPVDYVKIDGAFVRAANNNPRDRAMITSMVEISTSVGAQIVAETIETEEEARLMSELGVQFGQGWLFGRPGLLPSER